MDRNKIVEDNMKLVPYVLRRYYPTFVTNEDLMQEGYIGLMHAAETFEPERGNTFATYATTCIRTEFRKWFRRNAKYSNILSLDKEYPNSEEGVPATLADYIVGEEDVDYSHLKFEQFVKTLKKSDQELVWLLRDHNQGEVAEMYGVVRATISLRKRQIEKKWEKFNEEEERNYSN